MSVSRTQARRRSATALRQAVADRMAERVVDALEVVEVEAEHGDASRRAPPGRAPSPSPRGRARGSARPVSASWRAMCSMRASARIVSVMSSIGRDPAAVDHRLVADLHRAAVLELEPIVARAALEGARQLLVAIGLELSRPGADREPVLEHGQDRGAGQGQLRRQLVELGVAPVADDDPALGVEHAEPLGHGVEGGVEAAVLLGERALGRLALGDVLVRRDPAAVRHRLEGDREGAAVDKLEEPRARRAVLDRRDQVGGVLLGAALRVDAGREPMGEEIVVARAGLGEIGSEPVHLGVARVADDEPALAVEHAQAVGHVVEGGVEAQIVPRQLAVDLLQRRVGRGETLLRLALGGDVAADAAVAEEGAVGGKARLAADLEPAHAARRDDCRDRRGPGTAGAPGDRRYAPARTPGRRRSRRCRGGSCRPRDRARRRRPRQDGSRNRRSADPRPSPRTSRTRSRRNLRADVRTAPGAPS